MRRTKEEAEITKHNLLNAALVVFSQKGYTAATMDDIARQANVTTGAIYHHFKGKSDLYTALVETNSAKANQLAVEVFQEGGTPATILRRLLVRLFEFAEQDDEYRAVVELSINKTGFAPELDGITEQILASRRLLTESFAALIQDGIEAGEFHSSVSPQDAALALVGFLNGMGLIWVQDPEHFSIKQRADALVDIMFSGIVIRG